MPVVAEPKWLDVPRDFPWADSPVWYDRRGSRRTEVLVELDDPDQDEDYPDSNPAEQVAEGQGNCYSSYVCAAGDGIFLNAYHLPVLDVDGLEQRYQHHLWSLFDGVFQGAPQHWVRSTNNWHVYIGSEPDRPYDRVVPWTIYSEMLHWLAGVEAIDYGWARFSDQEMECVVRKPGVAKKLRYFNCMWCGLSLPDQRTMEEHEDGCAG